ncbi:MAG TPA: hypothetical protein PK224_18395 [Nitrospira sp.]|jgi:hypothetical protein|nr:hypothetical protein [Nitrospira sp.]
MINATPFSSTIVLRALHAVRLGLLFLLGAALLLGGHPMDASAKTKGKSSVPRPEPDLKILSLHAAPMPYRPQDGPFHFIATVQLPKEVDEQLMLEVSALVTSSSMTSLRFLSIRQPVNEHAQTATSAAGDTPQKHVQVDLVWDGLDHNKQQVPAGSYEYEVRVKLLSNGDKGQRTQMLAWPKRGKVVVKE